MRMALSALGIGLLTLATAAPAMADGIHIPGVNVQISPNTGYAPPVYTQRPYGGGPQARWQDPREFGFHVNQRMNNIEMQLRNRVNQGFVRPRALGEFQSRREDVEQELRSASADGMITWDERQHIMNDVQQMQALDVRFQRNAYGGGPGWNGNPDWR